MSDEPRTRSSPRGGILAIDHGTKRSGFAYADSLRLSTTALEPFHGPGSGPELVAYVAKLENERTIVTFLVGCPFNMDGTLGPRAADVQAFTQRLKARFPAIEVVLYDERLTTKAAEDLLRESGLRGREIKARRDSASALVLLRDWVASGEPR